MSLYRVSTATAYNNTINRINERTSQLTQTQDKLSAGKRVLRATDDPVAATLAERESNRLQRTTADLRALERSRSALEQAESTMGNMVDVLQRFKELAVQGGNTILSASDRRSITQEMRGLRDQLLNLSNTQDTEGNALLGGLGVTNTLGRPFADLFGTSNGVQFQAIGGQAAATENGLPSRVDGQFALMRNLTGDGTVVVNNIKGDILVSATAVVGELRSEVLPFDFSLDPDDAAQPQGRYEIRVVQDSLDPQKRLLEVRPFERLSGNPLDDVDNPVPGQPFRFDLGQVDPSGKIALNNKTVQFDGLQLTLNGFASEGDEIDLSPSQPDDLFATLQRAIDQLENPSTTNPGTRLTQELGRVHQEMQSGLDRLLLVRGRLGELLRRGETIESQLQDRAVGHQKELSNLTDLDMVKGISEFQNQQLGLQAALQSYAQVQRLSLFQYIA
jgi:flagellar hook-associated protein 3 FlgL